MRTLVRFITVCALALALGGPEIVRAENSCVAPYRTAELAPDSFRTDVRQDGPGWFIVAGLLIVIAFLLGKLSGPSKADVLTAVEAAFRVRRHEAGVHARRKLPAPLAEARRAVLRGLEGLGMVAPGWPNNPPVP